MSRGIAFFDFDGTITSSDSLAEIIRFRYGQPGFVLGLVPVLPYIMAFKIGLMDRQKAKEKLIGRFFAGFPEQDMRELSLRFARERIPGILRPAAMEKLAWHKQQGHEVVIVSASPDHWVEPWCQAHGFTCISTQLEQINGRITGRISGKNCYGEEKVRRIRERYALGDYSAVYAYGDTSGDRPMLELAEFAFYKPFRQN